jgi:hypothetical protein
MKSVVSIDRRRDRSAFRRLMFCVSVSLAFTIAHGAYPTHASPGS